MCRRAAKCAYNSPNDSFLILHALCSDAVFVSFQYKIHTSPLCHFILSDFPSPLFVPSTKRAIPLLLQYRLKQYPPCFPSRMSWPPPRPAPAETASFTLPMLQRLAAGPPVKKNHIRALVLTPTRELAAQVADSVVAYGKHLSLKSGAVFGGVNINPQIKKLRDGVDVLAATPGRLLDLYNQRAVKFTQLEILVLDEADRMLDMGFIRDIEKLYPPCRRRGRPLLFSATLTEKYPSLAICSTTRCE